MCDQGLRLEGEAGNLLILAHTSAQNYQEALRYIGKLPFEQAESNMKRYGKTLMHHIPEQTTQLLKGLCTNYGLGLEGRGDREALGVRVSEPWGKQRGAGGGSFSG